MTTKFHLPVLDHNPMQQKTPHTHIMKNNCCMLTLPKRLAVKILQCHILHDNIWSNSLFAAKQLAKFPHGHAPLNKGVAKFAETQFSCTLLGNKHLIF
jgi:hypothetical protein